MQDKKQILNTEKIYVKLLDEDIEVYRPVNAVRVDDLIYQILDDDKQAYKDSSEEWEFGKNDIVQCIYKNLREGNRKKEPTLIAIKKIETT